MKRSGGRAWHGLYPPLHKQSESYMQVVDRVKMKRSGGREEGEEKRRKAGKEKGEGRRRREDEERGGRQGRRGVEEWRGRG